MTSRRSSRGRRSWRAAAGAGAALGAGSIDGYAFTIAFKGVLLEGLEVAFIVLTFGTNQHDVGLAAAAAAVAVIVVVAAGVAVRAPLARVPENTMKFVVGVLLTSFGTFWLAEGAGAHWPGGDASLLGLIAVDGRLRRSGSWRGCARPSAGAAGAGSMKRALLGDLGLHRRRRLGHRRRRSSSDGRGHRGVGSRPAASGARWRGRPRRVIGRLV